MSKHVRIAVTAATILTYLTALGLGIAAIWTSRSNDVSSALGQTAGLTVMGMLGGGLLAMVVMLHLGGPPMSAPIYDATVKSQGTDPLAEADVIAAAEAITREVSA